jgi:hemerythrin-like domain-containing protein
MAEQMTMNRVIHNAVRRDLARLDAALDAAPDGDTERARQLHRAYAQLHAQLSHHHEQEDRLVFPVLLRLGIDEALVGEMDGEHHAMADALAQTSTAMAAYGASGAATDAATARAGLATTTQVVERHLTHEERELEPLMWPHFESTEWKKTEKELRKGPVREAGVFFAWLTDGMDPVSRDYLRSTVPPPVVKVLSKVFGRSYHRDIAPVWRN